MNSSPRLKSLKNRFQFSAGLNLEKFNTEPILFKPRLKFIKFIFGHQTWDLEGGRNDPPSPAAYRGFQVPQG